MLQTIIEKRKVCGKEEEDVEVEVKEKENKKKAVELISERYCSPHAFHSRLATPLPPTYLPEGSLADPLVRLSNRFSNCLLSNLKWPFVSSSCGFFSEKELSLWLASFRRPNIGQK